MKKIIKILLVLCCFCIGCEKAGDSVSFENKVYFPAHGKLEMRPLLGESIVELTVYRSGYNTEKGSVVEIAVDNDLLGDYEDKQAVLLPESMYSIEQRSFSFEKDEVEKKVFIQLKSVDESVVGKNYVLPIRVQSSEPSLVVEDKSVVYLSINNYRNQYEGKYRVQGERYLQHQEAEAEVIDYTANATTVSPNTFQIPSHINGVNLWVEIDGPTVKVKEAQNGDVLKISDLGSSMEGGFDATYQRFVGEFNLAYTYEAEGGTHEAHTRLKFDL